MLIFIGADHRGFRLKEIIKSFLKDEGYEVIDKGNAQYVESDDYPDFAESVAKEIDADPEERRGVLICGSGVGVDIVANKFPRVRSALVTSADQAYAARHDDDANVLSLAADFLEEDEARQIVKIFFATPFGNEERYVRRLKKIADLAEG